MSIEQILAKAEMIEESYDDESDSGDAVVWSWEKGKGHKNKRTDDQVSGPATYADAHITRGGNSRARVFVFRSY